MDEIDGSTRLTGVIGWPVEHSLSPAMHNAAFDRLGLNWRYLPLAVEPARLPAAVEGLRALGFAGANLTIPHKEAVLPLLDEVTPAAGAIGAVNTIAVEDGRLIGDNTDAGGLLAALERANVVLQGREALILGAGGAARAAAYALLTAGARVSLLARTPARAWRIADDLRRAVPAGEIRAVEEPPAVVHLLVNSTPVGMWPHADRSPLPAGLRIGPATAVFDMVYRPLQTRLLREARIAGARGVSGLDMLIYQGAAAFERWTGRPAPADIMRTACLRQLGEPVGP